MLQGDSELEGDPDTPHLIGSRWDMHGYPQLRTANGPGDLTERDRGVTLGRERQRRKLAPVRVSRREGC
jgi:hypothetical protein